MVPITVLDTHNTMWYPSQCCTLTIQFGTYHSVGHSQYNVVPITMLDTHNTMRYFSVLDTHNTMWYLSQCWALKNNAMWYLPQRWTLTTQCGTFHSVGHSQYNLEPIAGDTNRTTRLSDTIQSRTYQNARHAHYNLVLIGV